MKFKSPKHMGAMTSGNGEVLLGHTFWCPGCKSTHWYELARWTFNGNFDLPSFTPSLLMDVPSGQGRCHLYVTDGKIAYCGDCDHEYSNQTIGMVTHPGRN